jgi:hypothetical protein
MDLVFHKDQLNLVGHLDQLDLVLLEYLEDLKDLEHHLRHQYLDYQQVEMVKSIKDEPWWDLLLLDLVDLVGHIYLVYQLLRMDLGYLVNRVGLEDLVSLLDLGDLQGLADQLVHNHLEDPVRLVLPFHLEYLGCLGYRFDHIYLDVR